MSTIPNAASRVAAQTRQMQGKDLTCSKCGSEYMYEVQVTRYLSGGHGSVEIQADPNGQTFSVQICICGQPILPKPAVNRRAGGQYETAHNACRESVARAIEYRDTTNPEVVTKNLLEAAAGKSVEGHVNKLEDRVTKLETDLGEHPAENKPEHEKKKKDDPAK